MGEAERPDEGIAYVVVHDGLNDAVDALEAFCTGEYGRECEMYKAYIAKKDPTEYAVGMEEYADFSADLVDEVRQQVRASAFIKFQFMSDGDAFTVSLVPATHVGYLSERLEDDTMTELDDGDTVIIVEVEEGEMWSEAIALLDRL